MEDRISNAVRGALKQQNVSLDDYADVLKDATMGNSMDLSRRYAARIFCIAAAAGFVEDIFSVACDVIGPPECRDTQKTARFAMCLIYAAVNADDTGRESALRAFLQACRAHGEKFSIPTLNGLDTPGIYAWHRATSALCDWISQGRFNTLSLEFLDVLDLNPRLVSGGLSVQCKLVRRPSTPTLIAVMRSIPPDMWMVKQIQDGNAVVSDDPLGTMYAHNSALFADMLPHIPDAAFGAYALRRRPVVCDKASAAVSMSTFSAVWERSRAYMRTEDAAVLCSILLSSEKSSMHLQLELVLSGLSDDERSVVFRTCCDGGDGKFVSHAGILSSATCVTWPAAFAVVLGYILRAPQPLRLIARTTLSAFFQNVRTVSPSRREDVLRLLIEAVTDERALAATDPTALVHNWYIGSGASADHLFSYMRYVRPEFLDYMLERIPLSDAFGNQRHCDWLRAAAREKRYDAARVIERHLPRRAEVRQRMAEESPACAALIYSTLAKRAACT